MCCYLAGCARAVRLSGKQDERINLAADVIASAYIPFVLDVLQDAKARGFTHLYFSSRDGYIFYKIAKKISHLFPDIKLSYIYLSRKSVLLPSIYNKEDYKNIIIRQLLTPKETLKIMFNVSFSQIPEQTRNSVPADFWETPMRSDDSKRKFYDILANIIDIITPKAKEKRQLLLRYLNQEQLLENTQHAAIIDLGWGGSCRIALNNVLCNEGYHSIFWYFFGVTPISFRFLFDCKNPFHSLLTDKQLVKFEWRVFLLEAYFSLSAQNSAAGYSENANIVNPVFESNDINASHKETFEIHKETVYRIIELLLLLPHFENRVKYSFTMCGQSAYTLFFHNPSVDEARCIEKIEFGTLNSKFTIIQRINIFKIGKWIKLETWRAGSLTVQFPHCGKFLCWIYKQVHCNEYAIKIYKRYKRMRANK
jgi:hypothetical protein